MLVARLILPLALCLSSIQAQQTATQPNPTSPSAALNELASFPQWNQAQRAISEQFPEIAATELTQFQKNHSSQLSSSAQNQLSLSLLESLVRSEQYDQALRIKISAAPQNQQAQILFWRTQALLGLQRWHEALDLFSIQKSLPLTDSLQAWNALGQSIALRATQQNQQALELLIPLLNSTDPTLALTAKGLAIELSLVEKQTEQAKELLGPKTPHESSTLTLLRARLESTNGRLEQAENLLRTLLGEDENRSSSDHTPSASPFIEAVAALDLSHLQQLNGHSEDASAELVSYLESHPINPLIEAQIQQLADNNWHLQEPVPEQLISWEERAPTLLKRGAKWLLAQRSIEQKQINKAESLLEQLLSPTLDPHLIFSSQARIQLSILAALEGNTTRLENLLELQSTAREQQDHALLSTTLRARVLLANNQSEEALSLLRQALENSTQEHRKLLLYDLGWGALTAKNMSQFQISIQQLSNANAPNEVAKLQTFAFTQILQSDATPSQIIDAFQEYQAQSPAPQLAATTQLAVISWALELPENQQPQAHILEWLTQLQRDHLNPTQRQQADELQFWASLRFQSPTLASEALAAFDARYPDSPRREFLQLHLAEALYNAGDYVGALSLYDKFRRANPESSSAAAAAYGAAHSSLQVPNQESLSGAAQRFGEIVADSDSPFRSEALLGQIQALRRLGEPESAASLINQTIQEPWTESSRSALQCLLGEAQAARGPAFQGQAIAQWKQLIDDRKAPLYWRERAAFELGQLYEQTNQNQLALPLYRRVVQGLSDSEPDPQFYLECTRAALRILESESRWEAAVYLAEQAATTLGTPAGAEFTRYAQDLRLRYFLPKSEVKQ